MADPRHIRIFISAPNDIPDERAIALKVIDDLQYDPDLRRQFTRESITLDTILWEASSYDDTITPAPNAILPNQCDIVILVAWSHLGAPCAIEGESHSSSTAFVYHNAREIIKNQRPPHLLAYQRIRPPAIRLDNPQLIERFSQYRRAQLFFRDEFESVPPAERAGQFTQYTLPDEFRAQLDQQLRTLIATVIEDQSYVQRSPQPKPLPLWQGSPFPGLRAFQPKDASIFFGRGAETDKLAARVRDNQFVAVVGASSSGKSSLVGAGLIPRLRETATDHRWIPIPFTPDNLGVGNPFTALVTTLLRNPDVEGHKLAQRLYETPELLLNFCTHVLKRQPDSARLMLFIDQFEELFTTVDHDYRSPFIEAIMQAMQHPRVHVLVTVRSDFYGHCINVAPLAALLENSTFPLAAPTREALEAMIQRPADRAGLRFEGDLAARILQDTVEYPGSLALMAYTLGELYRRRADDYLTIQSYADLGGVQQAIEQQSVSTFNTMTDAQRAVMPHVFRELVAVKADGTVTRKRAAISHVVRDAHTQAFIGQMVKARLLSVNRGRNNQPYIEVAHESLLYSWDHLANWITETQAGYLHGNGGHSAIPQSTPQEAEHLSLDRRPSRRRMPSLRTQEDQWQSDLEESNRDRVRHTQELAQQHVENVKERARKKRETIEHIRRESEQRRLFGQTLAWEGIQEQTWHWIEVVIQRGSLEQAEVLSSLKKEAQTEVIETGPQELIRTLLHSSEYKERYFAAQKLTGKKQAIIILCLLQASEDDNEWVRQATVNALAGTHDPRVLPFLRQMTDDPHGDVSSTANAALAEWPEQV
ncbi:MAG: HEAT repeat domain-containing protein [Anaerolineae bacterium]|nr:HEAT repeat domain-containing protein [Anaerolineae bacterium]